MTETKTVVCSCCGRPMPAERETTAGREDGLDGSAFMDGSAGRGGEAMAEELRKRLPTALPVGGIITPV